MGTPAKLTSSSVARSGVRRVRAGEKSFKLIREKLLAEAWEPLPPYLDYMQQTERARESLRFSNQEKAGSMKGCMAHGSHCSPTHFRFSLDRLSLFLFLPMDPWCNSLCWEERTYII